MPASVPVPGLSSRLITGRSAPCVPACPGHRPRRRSPCTGVKTAKAVQNHRTSNAAQTCASAADTAAEAVASRLESQHSTSSSGRNGSTPATDCTATLLVQCPDAKGVVAALAQLLYGFNCNILESDQYTDTSVNTYFQRINFDFSDLVVGSGNTSVLERAIAELASRYSMSWTISYASKPKRLAVLVSKLDHCLYDLLIRNRSGELKCRIPIIISNHPDLQHVADMFGVNFRCLPLSNGRDTASKAEQERQIGELLQELEVDTIVLARYMQIFSPDFCARHALHTINIHHSFLPAFEGAKPYHRAHDRGVKVIGATAHYATSELDAGPIIEQDVTRITHRDSVQDMIRKGRDLERLVLARAVRWHCEDRVLVHGNKTVVFED